MPAASGAAAEPASAGQPQPAAAAALALAAPSQLLDSYRLTATSIVTSLLPGGDLRVAGTQLHGTWKRTAGPFGFDADFTLVNSSGDQRQQLGLVAIGDDAALLTDGAWSTIRRDSALPYTDPDSLLSLPFVTRINHGENLGRERLADVDVTHYRLTDPAVFAGAVQDILPLDAGSIRSVVLEGWVADAGFVVKYLLSVILDGVDYVDDAGNHVTVRQEIYATYGLSDVDAVPAIEWPADAQPPDTISVPGFMPNLFPLPEGATATPHLGLVEIRTLQTESEVADFYRSELGQLGWSFEGELGFYTAAKDGDVINLTILPDEASKETVIRVFAAGG